MQRHLALLCHLFPLPKRKRIDEETTDQILDRARQRLNQLHARNRERAVQAITQKNNLRNQITDLERTIQNLQEKAEIAVEKGDPALADQFLREKQGYEESLRSAEETFLQAEETAEQVKIALAREEEHVRQTTAEILAFRAKWKGCAIQQEMQLHLERLGVWHLAQPPEPEIDHKTARELVGFLLLLVIGLLIWIGRLI